MRQIHSPYYGRLIFERRIVMNTKEKVAVAIAGVELLACFVASALCFARAQYYQGRIDATEELHGQFLKQKDKLT